VETGKFLDRIEAPKDYYLIVSAFAPYKRIDLAIEAFRRSGRRLLVVGKGQDDRKLRKLASGAENIEFLGGLSNEALGELYRRARALIFPGLEDFGITPLESLYNGRPVIGYGRGGLLDTVTADTGEFFPEQNADSLLAALDDFERKNFDPALCRARALQFTREIFRDQYLSFLSECLEKSTLCRRLS
jgi:glycosyltransferase involved in cell wall biosynthesis